MKSPRKFEAVAESRKWRITASRRIAGMPQQERINCLNRNLPDKLAALTQKGRGRSATGPRA